MATKPVLAQPALPLAEIQGDVLIGLKKRAEAFLFFEITDVSRFKQDLKGALLPLVTFSDVLADLERHKAAGGTLPPFLGLNLAFTKAGLGKLADLSGAQGLDASFSAGAAQQADALNDDIGVWDQGYRGNLDGVILITGLTQASTGDQADGVASAIRHSTRIVARETGRVRSRDPGGQDVSGHEHFGFADGISQPGVAGLTPPSPADPTQGLPGQDILSPGLFVLGLPGPDGKPVGAPLPWMTHGSYMVFRKLEQKVLAFERFLKDEDPNSDLLGARLVGRWKSGAPMMKTSTADDPAMGGDPQRNNDFDFQKAPNADPHQKTCPFAAHIRKSYPRDDIPLPNGEEIAESHRILRAGIPFGDEVAATEGIGSEASRGLLFVCYQASIPEGFEFIQQSWCNNPGFVFGRTDSAGNPVDPGHDIVIGQVAGGANRTTTLPEKTLQAPPFVTSKGAAYFFAPSRTALSGVLAA